VKAGELAQLYRQITRQVLTETQREGTKMDPDTDQREQWVGKVPS
jgi:hypothetical protein